MSALHYIAAAMCLVAVLLHVDRSAVLTRRGTQGLGGFLTRGGLAGLLIGQMWGFYARGTQHAPFEPFHWFALIAAAAFVAGHIYMRFRPETAPPT